MQLDVFLGDGFTVTSLVGVVNDLPYQPTRIGSDGLFVEQPVTSTTVSIEFDKGKLSLVPAAPRGTPGVLKGLERRKLRKLDTVHLPQRVSMMADEIQNLRAVGSESEVETAQRYFARKMAVPKRDLDFTHEFQRIGAIKGKVVDADGSTVLLDIFSEFGLTPTTHNMNLDNDATKVNQLCVAAKRKQEDVLGAVMSSGQRAYCSAGFFDYLTGHPKVEAAYAIYLDGLKNRSDNRRGFMFGDIEFVEYRGRVNSTDFIEANRAYLVPLGVPDLFDTYYAPADYMETVNTPGVPFYAKTEPMEFNKGIQAEMQSNPLHLCTRPNSIIVLGVNAAALA